MPVAFCVSRLVKVWRVGVYIAAFSPVSVMQYIADLEGKKRDSVLDRSSVTFLMNLYARKYEAISRASFSSINVHVLSSQSIADRPVKVGGAFEDLVEIILTPLVARDTPSTTESLSEPGELLREFAESMPEKRRKTTSIVARSLTTWSDSGSRSKNISCKLFRGDSRTSYIDCLMTPLRCVNACRMQRPFGVSCQMESDAVNSVFASHDSMNLAVTNLLHRNLAICGTIENVVEIFVVTWRLGSSGDGLLFDCVNLRFPNRSIASAVVKVCGLFLKLTLCVLSSTATMSVENRSLKSCNCGVWLIFVSFELEPQQALTLEKGLSSSVHRSILCED